MPHRPTPLDWGRIHAKAWTDPAYRQLLETDPTAAIKQYADESGQTFDKILEVRDQPSELSVEDLDAIAKGGKIHTDSAPSCC